jgi:hypothetical protein
MQQPPIVLTMENSFEPPSLGAMHEIVLDLPASPPNLSAPDVEQLQDPPKHFNLRHTHIALEVARRWHQRGARKIHVVPTADSLSKATKRPSFWDQLLQLNQVNIVLPGTN